MKSKANGARSQLIGKCEAEPPSPSVPPPPSPSLPPAGGGGARGGGSASQNGSGTAARGDHAPPLHPLVQEFLDSLATAQRDRFTGRCAEAILISRLITTADAARSKRAARRPMTNGEARKVLKQAKLTTRHIREDGDPLHGGFATPCRSCTALSAHFGVRIVDPTEGN